MSGTRLGGLAAAEKNRTKDPDFYKKIGKMGGKAGTGHKFAHGRIDPVTAGKLGGRPPKQPKEDLSFMGADFNVPAVSKTKKSIFRRWR